MNLFSLGDFTLHSGSSSRFKIDCDTLTDTDIGTLAWMIKEQLEFGAVEGVPTGGLRLAKAVSRYITENHPNLLIVDDVASTWASVREQAAGRDVIAAVIFDRGPRSRPSWGHALFTLTG